MSEPADPSEPERPFDGIQFRAVALGVVVDHLATLLFSTLLVAIVASEDLFSADPTSAEAAREALAQTPSFVLSMLVGGSICTVLAAFAGARFAGERFVRHGMWIAVASAASVLLIDSRLGASLSWSALLGLILVLPAGWLGGSLARWAVEQQATADPTDD